MWSRQEIRHATKLKMYNALIVSSLLYGAETWTLTKTNREKLDRFDNMCLRKLERIHWYDFVRNETIRE